MKKTCEIALAVLLVLLVSAAFLWVRWTENELSTVSYEVSAPVAAPIRIVQLSDLHSWQFGEDNGELAELVADQSPDLILMTGDMLDQKDPDAGVVCDLIEELSSVAPVYYSMGNHEKSWERENGESLLPELAAAGAMVLDNSYLDLEVNGQPIRLGGYYSYYRRPHMYLKDAAQQIADTAFCEDFENTDRYKILLCHIPTAWLDWGLMDDYPVDLVLTEDKG